MFSLNLFSLHKDEELTFIFLHNDPFSSFIFFFTDSVSCSSITFPSGTLVFPKLLIVFQTVIAATKLSQFSCMFAPNVRSPFDFRGNRGMASDCSF